MALLDGWIEGWIEAGLPVEKYWTGGARRRSTLPSPNW
jgi:hypothetical protein